MLVIGVATADDTTALTCPWNDEGAGLAIGGWQINAGMSVTSSAQNGVVLARSDLYQQAGEVPRDEAEGDPEILGQGYSYGLHGQGTWNYQGAWSINGSQVDVERGLSVKSGRMNPSEDSSMMSYAIPPTGDALYPDNLTHSVGCEAAFASNYADLFIGGYGTKGVIGPGLLTSNVGMYGTGLISSSAGYNAITGIARNVTITGIARNVIIGTGHTTYHGSWIQSGTGMDFASAFRYESFRPAPY